MEKYNHKYGADQIQVLEGLEAVRKRPGMYIGSTSVRGLHHLVYEIVDNCVDEAMAGYCTEINVAIEPGNVISVEDNGRGIPVEIHPKTHISTAETVYTVLHAGGKFGGDSGYKVSGGLHGVGASVVNALSDWTEVTIQRDGGIYQMYFEKGKTVKKLEKIGNSKKTGTKVRFLADELTSIYGYLGTRIGVNAYRTGSFFFLLSRMLGTAAKLYLVCLILHTHVFQDMHIPFWVIAVGSVALVWIYTHKSGIKTIVWTDTLQTFCLIAALLFIIYFTIQKLDIGFDGIVQTIRHSEHSRIFVFDDWMSRQNFFKQFFSGIFIVIVMTGLDQDMMQKNLSCRNLHEAQKNMYCYGFSFIPLNFLFLCLGILLIALAGQMQLELPAMNDDILPMFATQGYLGQSVLVLFTIGIIAAAFSNSDSALTAMTTSVCIDLLNTDKDTEETARRKRKKVHLSLSILLAFFICLVEMLNNKSVIDAIYIIASYTYGPLLGMFAFGLFTRRRTKDRLVPLIAIASPVLCYALDWWINKETGYKFGYELLMLNGSLTFAGLMLLSGKEKTAKTP